MEQEQSGLRWVLTDGAGVFGTHAQYTQEMVVNITQFLKDDLFDWRIPGLLTDRISMILQNITTP